MTPSVRRVLASLVIVGAVSGPAAAAESVDASPAQPAGPVGFVSPSGNIRCGFPSPGRPAFVCEILEAAWQVTAVEECPLDSFRQVRMRPTGPAAVLLECRGDTWLSPQIQPLPYGQRWHRNGITCESARTGITCENRSGHGWTLQRASLHLR